MDVTHVWRLSRSSEPLSLKVPVEICYRSLKWGTDKREPRSFGVFDPGIWGKNREKEITAMETSRGEKMYGTIADTRKEKTLGFLKRLPLILHWSAPGSP